jgi:ketosteroid isomerase-like protein
MSHEKLVDLLRRAYEAFNAGDPSVWLGLYDPDIVLRVAQNASVEPGTFLGAKAVEGWFTELFRPFGKSFQVEVLEMIEVGDSVVVMQRNAARGRASGVEVGSPSAASVVTFRAGRVIRMDVVESREVALRLVGRPA